MEKFLWSRYTTCANAKLCGTVSWVKFRGSPLNHKNHEKFTPPPKNTHYTVSNFHSHRFSVFATSWEKYNYIVTYDVCASTKYTVVCVYMWQPPPPPPPPLPPTKSCLVSAELQNALYFALENSLNAVPQFNFHSLCSNLLPHISTHHTAAVVSKRRRRRGGGAR